MKIKTYLNIAKSVAQESKCISLKVGCVLVKDGEVISTGYNGVVSGARHCCDRFEDGEFTREEHHEWSKKYEVHAEMSAMLRSKQDVRGATAVITHSPCWDCVKHLLASGIEAVYFEEKYSRMTEEDFADIEHEFRDKKLIWLRGDNFEVINYLGIDNMGDMMPMTDKRSVDYYEKRL